MNFAEYRRLPTSLLASLLGGLTLLLSGCQQLDALRHAGLDGADDSPQAQVVEVLAYVRYVDGLRTLESKPGAALQSEFETLEGVVREHRRPVNRIKIAWLQALPGTRFHNTRRSLELLSNVTKELGPGPSPIRDLVSWMASMISYQRDMTLKLNRSRARLRTARSQNEQLQQQAESLQEQRTDLQQKIDALTNIETDIDATTYR